MHFYIVDIMNLLYFPSKQMSYFSESLNIMNL